MTEAVDCGPVVIGAGAIGLSIAASLISKHQNVVVLEAESSYGHHTSSRNSEVIHSGIYYTPGSLKSNLCLSGKEKLYKFLEQHDIPHNRCGKLILANQEEEGGLATLAHNAKAVSLQIHNLSSKDIHNKAPIAKGASAIFVPDTGIFDSDKFMSKLEDIVNSNNGAIAYNARVIKIYRENNHFNILVDDDRKPYIIRTNTIVNSAGLCADKIAAMAGFDNYKIFFYKGEYYKCNKIKDLPCLIYSVPPKDQMSLGIHTRNYLDGSVGFGPNAYPVSSIDYSIGDDRKLEFIHDIRKYMNIDLTEDDIWPDYAGIRPKTSNGSFKSDFLIKSEECSGNRQMINLIGMESPGLTCSLSIADLVSDMVQV